MPAEQTAVWTLAFYGLLAILVIAWQGLRCPYGWRVWFLYVVERLYCPLLWHWRANRRCPFPENGPAIVIANHRSPVDPLILWMNNHLGERNHHPRVISFLMAREYYELSLLGWLFRAVRSIPVERAGRDFGPARKALECLRQGELVGIFPEGRINLGEGLMEGDTGVAWLALRARVPVYPVFIHGSPQGKSMVDPFITPSRVRVIYGDPVDLADYYECRKTRELLQEVTDLLMERLAVLGGVDYRPTVPAERETAAPAQPRRVIG